MGVDHELVVEYEGVPLFHGSTQVGRLVGWRSNVNVVVIKTGCELVIELIKQFVFVHVVVSANINSWDFRWRWQI